ncbi:MAG: DUF2946 family protein [Acidovorax sp.]|jgi:hypothetical protein|uniref:DUF2946 family protein n=1 Tax=Acidovorax temperans TaxID=80878 RepID=UPI0008309AEE|nr:DUF2946 family protein [Acidovorax sp.]HRM63048.1 DUF2946 family protein [Acidovorax temperans]HRM82101.1 DUF2946 family protein [Acidovorax temperans]
MDDIVKQALAKWPNVPDCYGWLGLDARGRWFMRDDAAQAAGDFPQSRGSWLRHEKLIDFIGRNYESDDEGRWFFQNGPQRVYVELECTPWVWQVLPDYRLQSHTGLQTSAGECLLDEEGRLYIASPQGLGLVHSQDMVLAAEAVEQGVWVPRDVMSADLPVQYGFVRSPAKSQRR